MTAKKEEVPGYCRYRKYEGVICVLGEVSKSITGKDCVKCDLTKDERKKEGRNSSRRKFVDDRRFRGSRAPDRRKVLRRKTPVRTIGRNVKKGE